MAMAGADPFAIMKAMGHADIKTTMIYVSLGKSHIREQVEKLDRIPLPPVSEKKPPTRANVVELKSQIL
jgi:integrase